MKRLALQKVIPRHIENVIKPPLHTTVATDVEISRGKQEHERVLKEHVCSSRAWRDDNSRFDSKYFQ